MRAALVDINHLRRQRRGKDGAEIEIGGGCMQASRTSLEGDLHIKVAQILKVMAAYMHVSLVNQREHLQERLLLPKVRGYISNTEKMDAVSILYMLKNEVPKQGHKIIGQ